MPELIWTYVTASNRKNQNNNKSNSFVLLQANLLSINCDLKLSIRCIIFVFEFQFYLSMFVFSFFILVLSYLFVKFSSVPIPNNRANKSFEPNEPNIFHITPKRDHIRGSCWYKSNWNHNWIVLVRNTHTHPDGQKKGQTHTQTYTDKPITDYFGLVSIRFAYRSQWKWADRQLDDRTMYLQTNQSCWFTNTHIHTPINTYTYIWTHTTVLLPVFFLLMLHCITRKVSIWFGRVGNLLCGKNP